MYAYYAAIRNGTGRDIMIKLLIVDDEPLVQIGIKSMLRWDELGIEVCGTAMNGKAALEMIRQYQSLLRQITEMLTQHFRLKTAAAAQNFIMLYRQHLQQLSILIRNRAGDISHQRPC